MKRTATALLLGATAALAAPGCAPDATSIQIQYAMSDQPNASCQVAMSSNQRGGGAVDLGNTSRYWTAFKVVSTLEGKDLTAGGQTVNPGARNNFLIEGLKLSYSVTDGNGRQGVTIPDQTVADSGILLAGGSLAMGLNLLSPQAVIALNGYLDGLSSDAERIMGVSVLVSIALVGKFASGASYETAPFAFPLWVNKLSEAKCSPPGKLEVASGLSTPACSNFGQDAVPYSCTCTDCGTCDPGTTCNKATCACE